MPQQEHLLGTLLLASLLVTLTLGARSTLTSVSEFGSTTTSSPVSFEVAAADDTAGVEVYVAYHSVAQSNETSQTRRLGLASCTESGCEAGSDLLSVVSPVQAFPYTSKVSISVSQAAGDRPTIAYWDGAVGDNVCIVACSDATCATHVDRCFASVGATSGKGAPIVLSDPSIAGFYVLYMNDDALVLANCTGFPTCSSTVLSATAGTNPKALAATLNGNMVYFAAMQATGNPCPNAIDTISVGSCALSECATTIAMTSLRGLSASCAGFVDNPPAIGLNPLRVLGINLTSSSIIAIDCSAGAAACSTPVALPRTVSIGVDFNVPNGARPIIIDDNPRASGFVIATCADESCADGVTTQATFVTGPGSLNIDFAVTSVGPVASGQATPIGFYAFRASGAQATTLFAQVGTGSSAAVAVRPVGLAAVCAALAALVLALM